MSALSCQCLCGAVKFSASPKRDTMSACHCDMCRKWAAGPFMSTDCSGAVSFEDEEKLGKIEMSSWGERVFCPKCGSSLIWQTKDRSMQMVSVATFDDPPKLRFALEVFHDRKPDHYEFANQTKTMDEAEILAMFGSGDK